MLLSNCTTYDPEIFDLIIINAVKLYFLITHLPILYLSIFCRFVSITLVFLNKSLLSGGTSVDAPLFITCFQCTVTAAACYAIVSLPPNVWEAKNLACGQITISIQTLKKVLPLSVVCIDYLSYIVKRNPTRYLSALDFSNFPVWNIEFDELDFFLSLKYQIDR